MKEVLTVLCGSEAWTSWRREVRLRLAFKRPTHEKVRLPAHGGRPARNQPRLNSWFLEHHQHLGGRGLLFQCFARLAEPRSRSAGRRAGVNMPCPLLGGMCS